MIPKKKLIEVALPLEAINAASAREQSIRRGHPPFLHSWARRLPATSTRPTPLRISVPQEAPR